MVINFDDLSPEQVISFESEIESVIEDYNRISSQLLSSVNENGIELLFSNITSRNENHSDFLFLLKCLKFISKQSLKEGDTVIVSHKSLYRSLKVSPTGFKVVYRSKASIPKFRSRFYRIKEYLLTFKKYISFYLSRSNERKERFVASTNTILVDSFLHENSIKEKRYIDRYYCNMLDGVGAANNIFYLLLYLPVPTKHDTQIIDNGTKVNIIYPFDLLKLQDYLYALRFPFKKYKFNKIDYCGYDISAIIKECCFSGSEYFMLAPLYYRFLQRAKEAGADIKHVVDWYENQSYDRALYKGMNDFYPHSSIYAFFGYITDYRLSPHVVPTRSEYDAGVAPLIIYTCNRWLRRIFEEKSNYADCRVMSSFRAGAIWKLERKKAEEGPFKLLVPLSSITGEVVFKIGCLKSYLQNTRRELTVLLKPHPDISKEFVNSLVGESCKIEIVSGNIYDFLTDIDALVATNSSVLYEALALGIPVLSLFDNKGFFNCVKPDIVSDDMWLDISSPEDFDRGIDLFSNKGRNYYNKLGKELRKDFFEPVSQEKILELLTLNKKETT